MTKSIVSQNEILSALNNTAFKKYLNSFKPIINHGYKYKYLFRIGSDPKDSYVIKLRSKASKNIYNALDCFKWLVDENNLLERYVDVFELKNNLILITKWILGIQPCEKKRDSIPEFFKRIAILHKNNICDGPFTSMYADGKTFDNVAEMIDSEMNYHKSYYNLSLSWEVCLKIVENCKLGLTCVVHEDIHPGNMFLTSKGEMRLIDCEWLHRGLNLHQFDHMDFFSRGKPSFYKIRNEAKECYKIYFNELGVDKKLANDQIRGYEILSIIRKNTYMLWKGVKNPSEALNKYIEEVVSQKIFI